MYVTVSRMSCRIECQTEQYFSVWHSMRQDIPFETTFSVTA